MPNHQFSKLESRWTFMVMTVGIVCLIAVPARAADFGAKTSGNWSSSTTWTSNGGPPGANDYAFIGSTYPSGAAATATVMLTQNQQANAVVLGYGAGTSGTLNLGNFNLTTNGLYLGFNGGTGTVNRGTGSFDVGLLQLSASTLAMSASDRTEVLILHDGSSLTTAATANVSDGVRVRSGSTLTLGADLYAGALFDSYSIEVSGANSTLNSQGHKITTPTLSIGWEYVNEVQVPGSHVVNFLNRGDLDVHSLYVANQTLNLTANDRVRDYYRLANGSTTLAPGASVYGLILYDGSTATTTSVENITGATIVGSGSTLTLGADLNVTAANGTGGVDVSGNNSTLDAQGHKITATGLVIGGTNVRLLNRGELAVTALTIANQNFNLTPADQVAEFRLTNAGTSLGKGVAVQLVYLQDGASAATSATGNITGGVDVTTGSTLTLGADLSVSDYVMVYNGTLNAQGHTISAESLTLASDGSNVQLLNRGNLSVTNLFLENQNLNLGAADQVARFQLVNGSSNLGAIAGIESLSLINGSTVTTAVAGNLTGSVDVTAGSTLTLGADLGVSGSVRVLQNNSTLDAQFHKISAGILSLDSQNDANVRLLNKGVLDVTSLLLAGQTMDLSAADRVVNLDVGFASPSTASIVSTASTANVTGSVNVYASTLTLGADLNVSGYVRVGLDNATINAQGHTITADTLSLGFFDGGTNVRLLNRGNLAVSNLHVAQDFNLTTADRVTNFGLIYGTTHLGAGVGVDSLGVYDLATATTSTAENITGSVNMSNVLTGIGSKLTLGADLILSGNVSAYGHTVTIDAQGHNITANTLSFTFALAHPGDPNIRLLNDGAITLGGALALAGGVQVELRNGNDTAQSLSLFDNSGLTIKSAATGITIGGIAADELSINDTSTLTLELDGSQPGWVFRWANPDGGNHIADLNALITQNLIEFSVINGGEYNMLSQNGYTYIFQSLPEPSSLVPVTLTLFGIIVWRRQRGSTPPRRTVCAPKWLSFHDTADRRTGHHEDHSCAEPIQPTHRLYGYGGPCDGSGAGGRRGRFFTRRRPTDLWSPSGKAARGRLWITKDGGHTAAFFLAREDYLREVQRVATQSGTVVATDVNLRLGMRILLIKSGGRFPGQPEGKVPP